MTVRMARNAKEKVTVSVDPGLLEWADQLVADGVYESRSAAVEAALDALHARRMDERFKEALASGGTGEYAEGQMLAAEGLEEWLAGLDALDGGYGSEGSHAAG